MQTHLQKPKKAEGGGSIMPAQMPGRRISCKSPGRLNAALVPSMTFVKGCHERAWFKLQDGLKDFLAAIVSWLFELAATIVKARII